MRYILPFGYQGVNEFLEPDIAALRKYFSMSEEDRKIDLMHEYSHMFRDYLIEDDVEFDWPIDGYGDEEQDYQIVNDFLYNGDEEQKKFIMGFGDYLYRKVTKDGLFDDDGPTWMYFSGEPEIVKNQWLIHFTKPTNVYDIVTKGFTKGVGDMYRLGLTTFLTADMKKDGGYNFSYLLSDFYKYSGSKYGDSAIMFRASGVRMWHIGDEEHQVIFFGRGAKDRIAIEESEDHKWAASDKSGKVIYGNNDLRKVTEWVTRNFTQYRNRILRG